MADTTTPDAVVADAPTDTAPQTASGPIEATPDPPDPPAVPPQIEALAPRPDATKAGTCKTCKSTLERYIGSAAHKLGTGFCHVCGTRQVLKG